MRYRNEEVEAHILELYSKHVRAEPTILWFDSLDQLDAAAKSIKFHDWSFRSTVVRTDYTSVFPQESSTALGTVIARAIRLYPYLPLLHPQVVWLDYQTGIRKEACLICMSPTLVCLVRQPKIARQTPLPPRFWSRMETWMFDQQNMDEPVIVFHDDTEIYAVRNNPIRKEDIKRIKNPTINSILQERNMEIKSLMLRVFGVERYMKEGPLELVSRDRYGELYEVRVEPKINIVRRSWERNSDYLPIRVIKVINSSPEPDGTFKPYFLNVPREITTPHEGVAWTFNLSTQQYNPIKET